MKIVVLNGSPRKNGNTAIMVQTFAEAAGKQHQVCILDVGGMHMGGCMGCEYCHTKGGGRCVQQDDMTKVYEELQDADMVVFASPIYWFDITAQLKTTIDRLYACGGNGFYFHKSALFLNAAADHVFDAAIAQYKGMTAYLKWEDMGIITVPHMLEKDSMAQAPALGEVKKLAEAL